MAGLNKVLLIGNVGGDPEIRSLPSGSKVANFSLATSESYTDKNGQKQTQTEWHRVELWDNLASVVEQYVKKGDSLYVEGKIRNERWTDQNGQERTGIRIRGTAMQMLSGGNRNTENANVGSQSEMAPTEKMVYNQSIPTSTAEEDLPF